MSEWISVEKCLPPEYVRVLISCDEGICSGKHSSGQWQCDPIGSYAGDGCVFDVTHWMPLPEPPKKGAFIPGREKTQSFRTGMNRAYCF